MHHKRHRAKKQRAGCTCNGKLFKQNAMPKLTKVKGVHAPVIVSGPMPPEMLARANAMARLFRTVPLSASELNDPDPDYGF